jgi:hypothetical protein
LNGEAYTDGGGHGFFDEVNLPGPGLFGGFPDCAALHFGDAGWDGDEDPRVRAAALIDLADEVAEHGLCDLEVGDDAVLEGADGNDVARRAAEHSLCIVTHREYFIRTGFDRDDGRFSQDDAVIFDVNQGIRSAKVDAYIV